MAGKLQVTMVTPTRPVLKGEVDQVIAPSVMGQVTILPNHRPLLADLSPGVVELRSAGSIDRYAVSGGFIEVDKDHVTLLVETAERADEIDVDRAAKAAEDAEMQLKKLAPIDPAWDEQAARAQRNRARLDVAAH